jgi:hypothetical protein
MLNDVTRNVLDKQRKKKLNVNSGISEAWLAGAVAAIVLVVFAVSIILN